MATPRHLANAPIREAIVDVRVKARQDFKAEQFRDLVSQLAPTHPVVEEQRGFEAVVEFGPGGPRPPRTTEARLRGLIFKSADQLDLAQFRVDGFTVNRLKPYTSWSQIFPRALEFWRGYVRVARPEMVTRLALRYINRIGLPRNLRDFGEVMLGPPPVPADLPQELSRFLTRVTVHDPETGLSAHVLQALETDPSAERANLILDIDAFGEEHVEPDSERIRGTFEALHEFKNRIFFGSLTEQTVERYEK